MIVNTDTKAAADLRLQPAKARLMHLRWPRTAGAQVALGLLAYALVWLAHLSSTALSPPADNIEQLTWVHSLEWGYYKHPPLPTWLIWLPAQVFGINAWTSYALGAAVTLASMGLLWRLLAQLRGRSHATLALLAVLCITYYNGRLYYYNHNIVLMFFATASAALCWQAHRSARLRWWAALGVALGLGLLVKYQIVVTMVSVLAFWFSQRAWRDARQRQGLLLATLIVLLILVPHLQWLRAHDFGPINYAREASPGAHLNAKARWADSSQWLLDQLLNRALPAWLLLGAAACAVGRRPASQPPVAAVTSPSASRSLLLCWGGIPLLFMPLVGLLTGAGLQLQWGTPFMLFAVPAAMELVGPRVAWSQVPLRRALSVFIAIQVLLLAMSQLTSTRGPEALRDRHWRSFDSKEFATLVNGPARRELADAPLCVISGPAIFAGVLALELKDHPKVLIDGRLDRSPWLSADQAGHCGQLALRQGPPRPGEHAVGAAFPDLWWRTIPPALPPTAAEPR